MPQSVKSYKDTVDKRYALYENRRLFQNHALQEPPSEVENVPARTSVDRRKNPLADPVPRDAPLYNSQLAGLLRGWRTLISTPLTLTRELAGMDSVTKAPPAITVPSPTTVSPPSTLALE